MKDRKEKKEPANVEQPQPVNVVEQPQPDDGIQVPVLASPPTTNIYDVLLGNVGDRIEPWDLDKIMVPGAGGTTWDIPSLDGVESTRELIGVIVAWADRRAYWEVPYDESEERTAPDCSSTDGKYGIGIPGGACAACPFSQIKSRGDGAACKLHRLLLVISEGSVIPYVVHIPVMSISNIKKYFLRLASSGKAFWHVRTGFSLERTKNKSGKPYSVVVPRRVALLTDDEIRTMKGVVSGMGYILRSVTVSPSDE